MKTLTPYLPIDSEHQFSHGCPKCSYGIVAAPELTRTCDLHLERLVQAIAGDITFCDCQAGTRYRVYLLNRRQILIEEARKDPRMAQQAARMTHPDLDIAREHMLGSYAMAAPPNIHYEEA